MEHWDLDILVSDYYLAKTILDGDSDDDDNERYENGKTGTRNLINVVARDGGNSGGSELPNNNDGKAITPTTVDIRFLGDNYFDPRWEQDMLDRRQLHEDGYFYVPSNEDVVASFAYHALVHKNKLPPAVERKTFTKLQDGWCDEQANDRAFLADYLRRFMERREYKVARPLDASVGFNDDHHLDSSSLQENVTVVCP
jgi:hypothetical protein